MDELWGIVGRRGGKSRAFSVLGAYLAGLVDYSAVQAPGERIKLPIMASTTVQAAKIFSYMLGVFEHSAEMQDMVDGDPTADTIRLLSGVDIEVRPANYKTIRGETLAGCLADEVAFWHLENSANPDTLILDAVRPGDDGRPALCPVEPLRAQGRTLPHPPAGLRAERRSGGAGAAGPVPDHEPEPRPGGGEAGLHPRSGGGLG